VAWRGSGSTARVHARQVHTYLAAGGALRPAEVPHAVWRHVGMDPGEYPVGYFPSGSGLWFARRYGTTVSNSGSGPTVLVGSPDFVAGAVIGATVVGIVRQARARRAAAPQWRPAPLRQAVVTTRRLWCEVDGRWVRLGYDAIVDMRLHHGALEVRFQGAEDLRLTGAGVPWCAAVIAHYRYGPAAARVLPELAAH
jgi:hypothetical protein